MVFQGLTVGLGTVAYVLDVDEVRAVEAEADAPVAGTEAKAFEGRPEARDVALAGGGEAEDGVAELAGGCQMTIIGRVRG